MSLVNPADPIERQNEKLLAITRSLMRRIEQQTQQSGLAYSQFERAALLEAEVRQRTEDLERTLDLLHDSNAKLSLAKHEADAARSNLTDAIEAVEEGFALFDANEQLVLANSRFCRDFLDIVDQLQPGLDFETYVDLISSSRFLSLPDDMSREEWARSRFNSHIETHSVFNVELIFDRWLQVSEHRTETGGIVILQTDVTDIMRLERQERDKLLDRQARMVRATLDHLNQGICIFDRNETLVDWNSKLGELLDMQIPQSSLGIAFETLLSRMLDQVRFSGSFTPVKLIAWTRRRTRRTPITFEIGASQGRTLIVHGQEMPDRGFVLSFTDISAERAASAALTEMNEQLERRVRARTLELDNALDAAKLANATKTRFVAAASHDLLQPLSAAKLFVASLEDSAGDDSARMIAGKALSALGSVEQIIEALLDISKLDSGRIAMDVREVELAPLLQALENEQGYAAKAKGLELRVVPSSLSVESDPAFLRRILQNLVNNAIRYTRTGRVTIGVRRSGSHARIEVWDTGIGIAEEDRARIFEEFQQVGTASAAEAGAGLGLGLAIVERACQSLGHELVLQSELGRGSCFSVSLPRGRKTAREMAAEPGDDLKPDQRNKVILLIENDQDLAHAISVLIESWGSYVLHAPNGADALALLREIDLTPDALLIDYQLEPDMTGIGFYERYERSFGATPARVISANRSTELRDICAGYGLELMAKPIPRGALARFIDTL